MRGKARQVLAYGGFHHLRLYGDAVRLGVGLHGLEGVLREEAVPFVEGVRDVLAGAGSEPAHGAEVVHEGFEGLGVDHEDRVEGAVRGVGFLEGALEAARVRVGVREDEPDRALHLASQS